MAERKRKNRIVFRVTTEENELINKKMKQTGILNREAFLRKMSIDGYVLQVNFSEIRELIFLLRNATNNLNQITKRINETHNIYKADVEDIKMHYEKLWDMAKSIMKQLTQN